MNNKLYKSNEKKNYMKFFLFLFVIALVIVPLASAETTIGTYKQFKCVNLIQICSNCTYNNISSISYPDSTVALSGKGMQKTGTFYNYTFCDTTKVGTYIVNGFGDLDGTISVWNYNLEVTPTGEISRIGFFVLIFLLAYTILLVGIFTRNIPVTILGGFATTVLGLYTLNNGIDVYRNFATEALSILTLSFGGFWMVKAAMEYLDFLD